MIDALRTSASGRHASKQYDQTATWGNVVVSQGTSKMKHYREMNGLLITRPDG